MGGGIEPTTSSAGYMLLTTWATSPYNMHNNAENPFYMKIPNE